MPTTADKLAALEAELAAQRARVEELERKAKPPAPFDPGPYQRYDPTAGMSMPQSAIDAMVAAEPEASWLELWGTAVHQPRQAALAQAAQ